MKKRPSFSVVEPSSRVLTAALLSLTSIVAVPDSITAAELVAHWDFEDAADLGKDSSGKDNHGDAVEVEQVEGISGMAGFFDESLASTVIKYDGLAGFTGKPGVTLAAWVKLDEFRTGYDGIISQDGGGCCDNRILLTADGTPYINLSEHSDRNLAASPVFELGEWTHIAMTGLDGSGGAVARIFVNGVEVEESPQQFPLMDDGSAWNTYLGAGEAGTSHLLTGALDDVRVYEGALTIAEVRDLVSELKDIDADDDGLPDVWEERNDLNPGDPADAALDLDGDTLTTLQEFERGTNPTSDDTDGDGLKDNVETNTGIWVSAEDTGTDPFLADTDGDSLLDGAETNTGTFASASDAGTDPHKRDTDGDGASDGSEVVFGTDPTNPASNPDLKATLVAHYEFEDPNNLGLDSSGNGNDAVVAEVEQVEGMFGQAGFFDEALGSSFVQEGGLKGFVGKPGVSLAAWVKLDENTTGYDGIISQDPGGCCQNRILLTADHNLFINLSEHDDRNLTDGPYFEIDQWVHVVMVGIDTEDGSEAHIYVNGEEIEGSPQLFSAEMDPGNEWSTYIGAGESGTAHLLTGAVDDVRIYQGALTEEEIQGLLTGSTGAPFQVTKIVKSAEEVTLSWNSTPSGLYLIDYTSDLSNPEWIELEDGIASEGDETEFTDDDPEHLSLPQGYYRVRR
ncbi:MAG: LamG domain-containing protein [Verrucomicrobiae bacterium]|nr:LamG domain-containing protein [Verrucomicrobiae bacterium]